MLSVPWVMVIRYSLVKDGPLSPLSAGLTELLQELRELNEYSSVNTEPTAVEFLAKRHAS